MTEKELAELILRIRKEADSENDLRKDHYARFNLITSAYHDGKIRMAELVLQWINETNAEKMTPRKGK